MATERENRGQPRAPIKWHVTVKSSEGEMEGATLNVSLSGAFIRCAKPLGLNKVFDMAIHTPRRPLSAKAEVVWSNIYGPDDEITPRGMGVMFTEISGENRKVISEAVQKYLKLEGIEVAPETIELDLNDYQ